MLILANLKISISADQKYHFEDILNLWVPDLPSTIDISSDISPTVRWRGREAIGGVSDALTWSEMTLTVPRHVPGHIGMLSTGHHGSHTISTGRVPQVTGSLYTAVYSPEQTI